jgi:hypothetical protein
VPLTAAVWSEAVFLRRVEAADLVVAILGDRQASFLCYGLAGLDDETLEYLSEHPAVLTHIYTFGAEPFAVFSASLRVEANRIAPPGGSDAVNLWEAVVGEPVTRPDRFIQALFTHAEGRLASLYDTIGHLDPPRQRFALGLWMTQPADRLSGMHALAAAAQSADWRSMKALPFARQSYDLAAALMRVGVDAGGQPAFPSSQSFWARAMESADLPDDPAGALRNPADDRPIDAAWLARQTAPGDARVRAERLDQIAFAQRAFGGAAPAAMPEILVATRAFRRYRMLMLTFERIGIRDPAVYAAAARVASRLSSQDSDRAFVATAQFQASLALVSRMYAVGTLDDRTAATLVGSLLAVPVQASGYAGGVLEWMSGMLRPVMPPGDTFEAAIEHAISGRDTTASSPRVEWEGQRYRVDVATAERRRMQAIREKQAGATVDIALELAGVARALRAGPSAADARRLTAQLTLARDQLAGLSERDTILDTEGFPAGVVPPPSALVRLNKVVDELTRAGAAARSADRSIRAADDVREAADEAAAQALVSIVYAMDLGDPDGAAMLPADVSRRHDFGFGQRDTEQRLRAAWMMPRQDVSPGVPWHVDGSLLGLDVALATMALRRLSADRALAAPTLTSNERETLAAGFGMMNAFTLTDASRDAIAGSIERGRARVARIASQDDVATLADEVNIDARRRRAIRWTAAHERERVESLFSLRELLALGSLPGDVDLDPWGTSAMVSTGCLCLRMPPPGRLPLLTGRPQIGLLATAVPDLNLHVARTMAGLRVPARLGKYVLSAALQDFMDEVRATDHDDWLSLVRAAAAVPRDRIEDYIAAAAADGPLLPDSPN